MWIVAVHKWNTKTDMQLLSSFCHVNSPDISMHVNKNFNTLLKAGSLMITFFLMDPPPPPPPDLIPSVRLKPWEKKDSMKPVTQLDNFTSVWLSGGSLMRPCSSGPLNPLGCAVNKFRKSWGLWTFLIAILSVHAETKTWKRIADRLSNELLSRSLSCVSDESQFLLQQVDHAIEETPVTSKLPFDVLSGSCPFWRAREWAAWPAMSALKAFGRAQPCRLVVGKLTKRQISSQHSLAFRD